MVKAIINKERYSRIKIRCKIYVFFNKKNMILSLDKSIYFLAESNICRFC